MKVTTGLHCWGTNFSTGTSSFSIMGDYCQGSRLSTRKLDQAWSWPHSKLILSHFIPAWLENPSFVCQVHYVPCSFSMTGSGSVFHLWSLESDTFPQLTLEMPLDLNGAPLIPASFSSSVRAGKLFVHTHIRVCVCAHSLAAGKFLFAAFVNPQQTSVP